MADFPGSLPTQGTTNWEYNPNSGANSFPSGITLRVTSDWEPWGPNSFPFGTAVSQSVSETEVQVGETVTITGTLTREGSALQSQEATIHLEGDRQTIEQTTTSDGNGDYSKDITIQTPDDYSVYTTTEGRPDNIFTSDWEYGTNSGANTFPTAFQTTVTTNWEPA